MIVVVVLAAAAQRPGRHQTRRDETTRGATRRDATRCEALYVPVPGANDLEGSFSVFCCLQFMISSTTLLPPVEGELQQPFHSEADEASHVEL